MTWYTSTYDIMIMGFLYRLDSLVKYVCLYGVLDPMVIRD